MKNTFFYKTKNRVWHFILRLLETKNMPQNYRKIKAIRLIIKLTTAIVVIIGHSLSATDELQLPNNWPQLQMKRTFFHYLKKLTPANPMRILFNGTFRLTHSIDQYIKLQKKNQKKMLIVLSKFNHHTGILCPTVIHAARPVDVRNRISVNLSSRQPTC